MILKPMIVLGILLGGLQVQAKSIYNESINDISGKTLPLANYKGKTLLVVNIATRCGYTPQLDGLEALYKKFKEKNFVILGIPSNDFGGQTPEADGDIKKFCKLNYGVSFPLTAKTVVKGPKRHPLISNMISQSTNKDEIDWNFEKFLIDKKGKVVERFDSAVKPEDRQLLDKITSNL